jgi:hypothetical protein
MVKWLVLFTIAVVVSFVIVASLAGVVGQRNGIDITKQYPGIQPIVKTFDEVLPR